MSDETKKDPTLDESKSGNSLEDSSQPEGTGKEPSSPTNPSGGNEDRVKELETKIEELSTKYAESSKEGKRLKSLLDEKDESLQEKEEYIQSLEEALENETKEEEKKREEKKEEEKVDVGFEKEPSKEKVAELKKQIDPHLTKEGQRKMLKELLEQERKEEKIANEKYEEALKDFPQLKNKTFSKLVSQKMKLEKVGIKEACKSVKEDLGSLGAEEIDTEPFVEGGGGKSTTRDIETEEDKIRNSLKRNSNINLPGF